MLLKSFPQGALATQKLLEFVIGRKRLERLTERIGGERVQVRDQEVKSVEQLTLMDKLHGPDGVIPPMACAVMADGGRVQRHDRHPDSKTHWYEYKAGLCLELGSRTNPDDPTPPDRDPCPQVPAFLLNFEQIETLTREINQSAAATPEPAEAEGGTITLDELDSGTPLTELLAQVAAAPQKPNSARELPWSPRVRSRDVVATCGDCREFGRMLVTRAWQLGLFQAERKAFRGRREAPGSGSSGMSLSRPSDSCRFWTSFTRSRMCSRRQPRDARRTPAGRSTNNG